MELKFDIFVFRTVIIYTLILFPYNVGTNYVQLCRTRDCIVRLDSLDARETTEGLSQLVSCKKSGENSFPPPSHL